MASGRIDDLGEQQNRVPSYGQSCHGFSNFIGDIYTFFKKIAVAICSNCAQANISVMFLVTESINRPSLLLGWLARGW